MTPTKRHGGLNDLPQRSLATFTSTGVSLLVAANHDTEREVAVLDCPARQEKGTRKHAFIPLCRIICKVCKACLGPYLCLFHPIWVLGAGGGGVSPNGFSSKGLVHNLLTKFFTLDG